MSEGAIESSRDRRKQLSTRPNCCSFPWIPLPSEMIEGVKFTLFEEDSTLGCSMIDDNTLIRIDSCGYFLYWFSPNAQKVQIIETSTLEDVEFYKFERSTPSGSVGQDAMVILSRSNCECLRLQIRNEDLLCFNVNEPKGKDGMAARKTRTFFLSPASNCNIKCWEETLLCIGLKHRCIHENYTTLDLLLKQWTYLRILYGHSTQTPDNGSTNVIPFCCICSALGGELRPQEVSDIPVDEFSFERFFALFIQAWPREDIVEIYNQFSDHNGLMSADGLQNFLHTTLGNVTGQWKPKLTSATGRSRPRKVKHVDLMQWEARRFYRKGRKLENSKVPRSPSEQRQVCARLLKKNEHSAPFSTTNIASTNAKSNQNAGNVPSQGTYRISSDDFSTILKRYEENRTDFWQGYLSPEGFYRFLLSADYITVCRYRTLDKFTQMKALSRKFSQPLSHYYIDSVIIGLPQNQSPRSDLVNDCDPPRYGGVSFLRALRQLLLLGTRAIVVDCWVKCNEERQLMLGPSNSAIAHYREVETEPAVYSNHELRAQYSAPIQIALDTMYNVAFLTSPYPLVLLLRLDELSMQDQNQLATYLQKSFQGSLLCPPLPKYTAENEKYFSTLNQLFHQTHQPLPSPEMLKHKIILSIWQPDQEYLKSRQPTVPKLDASIDHADHKHSEKSPLTILVTDPEGEEKIPRQDTTSTGSGSQISPKNAQNIWPNLPCGNLRQNQSLASRKGTTPSTLKKSQNPKSIHPRLMRLVCLPCPPHVPEACRILFEQHFAEIQKSISSTEIHERTNLMYSADFFNNIRAFLQNDLSHHTDVREDDDAISKDYVDKIQLLLLTSSLVFAKLSRALHRRRKEKLLKRLLSKAYRENKHHSYGTTQYVSEEQINHVASSGPLISGKEEQSDKTLRATGIRHWFSKRRNSPKNIENVPETRRPSLLFTAARRLSNVSLIKWDRSPSQLSTKETFGKFSAFRRKLSSRSSGSTYCKNKDNKPFIKKKNQEESPERASIFESLIIEPKEPSSSSINSDTSTKPEETSWCAEQRGRSSADNSKLKLNPEFRSSKKGTCGHCSCSSGSKSSVNSSLESLNTHSASSKPLGIERTLSFRKKNVTHYYEADACIPPQSDRLRRKTSRNSTNISDSDKYSDSESSESTDETSFTSTDSGDTVSVTEDSSGSDCSSLYSSDEGRNTCGSKLVQADSPQRMNSVSSNQNFIHHRRPGKPKKLSSTQRILAWKETSQWLTTCKLAYWSPPEIFKVLPSDIFTRCLAEFTKFRLLATVPLEMIPDDSSSHLLRLLGCQIVPKVINVPPIALCEVGWTEPISVKQQIDKHHSLEVAQLWSAENTHGYFLKPLRLRLPTRVQAHRYPKAWTENRVCRSNKWNARFSHSMIETRKWPFEQCTCCYDPLIDETNHKYLKELYVKHYAGVLDPKTPIEENMLPWSLSFQPLQFLRPVFRKVFSPKELPDLDPIQSIKLPRRYHRAVSSGGTHRKHHNSKQKKKNSRKESERSPDNCQIVENTDSNSHIMVEFARPSIHTSYRPREWDISIMSSIHAGSSYSLNIGQKIPHAHTFEGISNILAEHKDQSSENRGIKTSRSTTFDLRSASPHVTGQTKFPYSTIPEMSLLLAKLEGVLSPESIGLIASKIVSMSSPLRFTPTGYQHVNMKFVNKNEARKIPFSCTNQPSGQYHKYLGQILGIPLFCKVELDVYKPPSLGELMDSLSQEIVSRSNSLPRSVGAMSKHPQPQRSDMVPQPTDNTTVEHVSSDGNDG